MRLRKRTFHAKVQARPGPAPIVLGFGLVCFEATIAEARELALAIIDAIDEAQKLPQTGGDTE